MALSMKAVWIPSRVSGSELTQLVGVCWHFSEALRKRLMSLFESEAVFSKPLAVGSESHCGMKRW